MKFFKNPRFSAIFTSVFLFHSTLFAAGINPANKLKIGDKTASDKVIEFDKGSGTTNPKIKWSNGTSKLQFTHDGTNFKDIGSGAGGGGGVNLLVDDNFDFEAGTTNWTVSGGTLTSETGSPLFGAASGSFDASASSQNLDSTTKTIPVGLRGTHCLAQVAFRYPSGSSGDYKIQALDGSLNVLAEASIPVTTGSGAENAYVVFSCPTSGSIKLRIASTVNGSALIIDNAHLGSNTREVQVASAAFAGSSYFDTTSTCYWFRTNTALGAFSTTSACPGPTIDAQKIGTWSTTDTDLPKQTIDLPPGLYRITVSLPIRASTGGAEVALALSDGTNTRGRVSYIDQGGGAHVPVVISAWFEYSSAGSRTFEIFGASNTGQIELNLGQSLRRLVFHVERYPLASEQAVAFDKASAMWSGYHSTDCTWARTNTAFGDPAADTTCTFTQRQSMGLGTVTSALSGSDKLPGIVFTPSRAGMYLVKVSLPIIGGGIAGTGVGAQLTDGTDVYEIQEASTLLSANAQNMTLLALVYLPSTAAKTIKLQTKSASGSVTIGGGFQAAEWSLVALDSLLSGVTFSNMVSTPNATGDRLARASITGGNPPTISSQSGSWISFNTRTSAGDYTFNVTGFSAPAQCVCSAIDGGQCALDGSMVGSPSSSTIRVKTTNATGGGVDVSFHVLCIGPK